MARQVVSYDDLAPSSSSSSKPSSEGNNTFLARKRRREGDDDEEKVTRDDENAFNGDGTKMTAANFSFQNLPPKPQVKKRGRNKQRFEGGGEKMTGPLSEQTAAPALVHWDDPGTQADEISYEENNAQINQTNASLDGSNRLNREQREAEMVLEETEEANEEDEEDESRELTHEEIWDDSALVAAWDAANEEYEAIHGKNKRWKKERVHKSPLWYNIPPEKPKAKPKGKVKAKRNGAEASSAAINPFDVEASSSVPLNFKTYVPTHDPSLAFPGPSNVPSVPEPTQGQLQNVTAHYSSVLASAPSTNAHRSGDASTSASPADIGAAEVSADDAFSRALGAMYWCGYWTAVYHVQRGHEQGIAMSSNENDVGDSTDIQEEEETVELLSTQR